MGKKKNLKGLDDAELDLINYKMGKKSTSDYIDSDGIVNVKALKTLFYKINVKCKTERQKEFFNALKDETHQICFGIGSPGTGKSFISLVYALKALKDGLYSKIVMVIPTAQAGGADLSLGYLKGDFFEKTVMFTEADKYTISKILKLSGNENSRIMADSLINNNFVEYEYVNFLLGKTIDNAIILVNEAEQFTRENMRLILSRIGENSKIIVTGDAKQVNRNSIKKKTDICGLSYCVDKLSDMEEVSVTEFTNEDIVRNGIITKILERLD